MKKEIPQIKAYPSDAGYFLWLDCREMAGGAAEMARFICKIQGCAFPRETDPAAMAAVSFR